MKWHIHTLQFVIICVSMLECMCDMYCVGDVFAVNGINTGRIITIQCLRNSHCASYVQLELE